MVACVVSLPELRCAVFCGHQYQRVSFYGEFPGTVASFIGFDSYIQSYKIKTKEVVLNANRKQGYWGFETTVSAGGFTMEDTLYGAGTSRCHNCTEPDLFHISHTTRFVCCYRCFLPGKLTITGNETKDIVVQVALSTNKSFEWIDRIADGKWEPGKGNRLWIWA